MIKLFKETDKLFSTNGDRVILPLSAIVHKEDNGDFYLDLTTSLKYVDDLTEGRILVANTPQGDQAFRVSNVQKSKNKVYTKAWHVFYDTENYLIEDSYVVDKNCNDALDHLNTAAHPESPFTTLSDVNTIASYRCIRQSLYAAIQTVIERWGGHLSRDNFTIKILNQIGQDNGVEMRYGKNIKDISVEYDWTNVVTELLPVGYDGIMLEDKYVYADATYDIPYTKCVHFDQDIDEDDYKDEDGKLDEAAYQAALRADLFAQAQAYVAENQYPKVNYTLDGNLEKITDVGDTVAVNDERLGVKILTNVIAYDYDVILEKYISLQFGNFRRTLNDFVNKIATETEKIVSENNETIRVTLSNELAEAADKIWGALGNSYVIYEGDKILVVDRLPKETATNVIMINNGGIAFSQTGINGTFNSAWTIDGVMNMQNIDVINLTSDMIKGGTFKLGSNLNQSGILEVYDDTNAVIAVLDKNGLRMNGVEGSYVLINNEVGFAGYDRLDNKIYWVDKDEFHQRKSVIEEEITLCAKARFIPITITSGNTITNDGVGIVSVGGNS